MRLVEYLFVLVTLPHVYALGLYQRHLSYQASAQLQTTQAGDCHQVDHSFHLQMDRYSSVVERVQVAEDSLVEHLVAGHSFVAVAAAAGSVGVVEGGRNLEVDCS